MLFQEVIGQSDIKGHLREMVQHNRISHALLFLGKEGCGALPLAIAFAQYIVCQQVKENPGATDACGTCAPCQKAKQLMHPDILFSYPVIPRKSGDKPVSTDYISEWREFISQYPYGNVYDWLQFIGAENKQGNITAQECNDILRRLTLKSFESEFKVLILWMPEYLGNEGNKLLKIIEEPPANTLFILVAENDTLILPTILSRTQLVKIPPITHSELAEALVSRAKLPRTGRPVGATGGRQLPRGFANDSSCRRGLELAAARMAQFHTQDRTHCPGKMGGRDQQAGPGKAKAVFALFQPPAGAGHPHQGAGRQPVTAARAGTGFCRKA